MEKEITILNWQEAGKFVQSIKDKTTRDLLQSSMMTIINHFRDRKHLPDSNLDILFVVEALEKLLGNHHYLEKALRGEQLDMFEESDEER